MLVRIPEYYQSNWVAQKTDPIPVNKDTLISFEGGKDFNIELYYLNEKILSEKIEKSNISIPNLLQDKHVQAHNTREKKARQPRIHHNRWISQLYKASASQLSLLCLM